MGAPDSEKSATLFVRNLPRKTTSADLEAHFGGIGPIRRCFVVTDAGTSNCKGFGFVHYALPEDAEEALKRVQRSLLHGRKITLDLARPRLRNGGREGVGIDEDGGLGKTPKPKGKDGDNDDGGDDAAREGKVPVKKLSTKKAGALSGSLAMRTVVVRSATKGDAITEQEAREAVGADDAESMFESCVLVSNATEARCVFASWPKAGKAAAKAHGEKYDACVEALQGGKRSRLIVRNLPFTVSLTELRSAFEKIAPVRELKLAPAKVLKIESEKVKKASDDVVACGGYAFVEYFLVSDAKFAISKMNGAKVGGRIVAVDMAIGKAAYVAQAEAEREAEEEEGSGAESGVEDEAGNGVGDKVRDTSDEDSSEASSPSDSEDESSDDEDLTGGKLPSKALASSKKQSEPKTAVEKKAPTSTERELMRTVFVRNLLFETSAPELWKAMEDGFGPVEQAVIVTHPATGRPRGTAFVRFKSPEDAEKAIMIAGEGDTSKSRSALKQSQSGGFSLQGRQLMISKAVDRSKAKEMGESSSAKDKTASDPRNLRLAEIGQIKAGTREARGLSEQDLARRAKAAKDKQAKLSHNPNSFVSHVRLSVRNLPRDFDEKTVKHMFLAAASTEKSPQKKRGKEDGDTSTEGHTDQVRITHCTVVRDEERKDRSKGYAFVQFAKHEHALKALHAINNNPRAVEALIKASPKALTIDAHRARLLRKQWGVDRRLVVEFSVEDRRMVKIIERVKEKGKKLSEAHKQKKLEERSKSGRFPKSESSKKGSTEIVQKKLSKSEKKSALKRQRAEDMERQERKEKQRRVSSIAPAGGQGHGRNISHVNSESRDDRRSFEERRQAEKRDPKPKKPKRKRSVGEMEKDTKFDNLVDSYKRKLAKTAATPKWFT